MAIYYLRYYIKNRDGEGIDAGQLGERLEFSNDKQAIKKFKQYAHKSLSGKGNKVSCTVWREGEGVSKKEIRTFIIKKGILVKMRYCLNSITYLLIYLKKPS